MTTARILMAAAALGAAAGPAAAQYYPQYPQYPQTYPQYPQQTYPQYPQQAYPYGYNQPYTGNPAIDIIDQLLGNRYTVTDRQAIRACANAARNQALGQYGGYAQGQGYGYGQGYGVYANGLHVTAITNVEHRSYGLRVYGMLGSGAYPNHAYPNQYGQYGTPYGYQNNYAPGELSFRCNVDYRGAVADVRVWPGHRG